IYEYLLTDNQASVNHFISEKYSKEGNERKEIAWSKAYICTNDDSCVAQFRQSHNTQLFHIAKLGIQKPVDRNKGIMTI
ncbi:hypothetical protein, partial [Klebsiella pneumoniae]|uniref:hypothetical protein n=1 Tax=Klebsiella pneumoniae TaxID=573 RepID=UPI00194F3BDD